MIDYLEKCNFSRNIRHASSHASIQPRAFLLFLSNLSLSQAINRYAPSSDNNLPERYIAFVSEKAGIDPREKLADLTPFQFLDMIKAMIEFEGWKE